MPLPAAILITRPEPQASRLAAALRAEWGSQLEICLSPLMEPEFLMPVLPEGPFTTLLLTSEAGAEAARRLLAAGEKLPQVCACVGQRTAGAVRGTGIEVLAQFPTASDLLASLIAAPAGPYLYLHGKDVSLPLDRMLNEAGQHAEAVVVYAQQEVPLTSAARALLNGRQVIVPLYSARSVRLLLQALPRETLGSILPCAVSRAVAEELPPELAKTTTIAETPDGSGMVAAIRRAILA